MSFAQQLAAQTATGLAAQLGGDFAGSGVTNWAPQGSRVGWPVVLSDANVQAATYRQHHRAFGATERVRVLVSNPYSILGTPATTTYEASIETGNFTADPNGATTLCTRLTFDGLNAVTLAAGEWVWSDPVDVTIAAGAIYCTRVYASVPVLGQRWSTGNMNVGTYTSGATYPNGLRVNENLVAGGSMSGAAGTPNGLPGICGVFFENDSPRVVVLGDSITAGSTEQSGPLIPYYGWVDRAFDSAGYGAWRIGINTLPAHVWLTPENTIVNQINNLIPEARMKNCICQLGINDLTGISLDLATLQTRIRAVWAAMREAGIEKLFQTTLTPYATSTDLYATLANQTPACPGISEATRTSFNDWIRSGPVEIDGYFELADACESSRNSGKWKVNGANYYATVDGIHPISVIHQFMADAVNTAEFI